MLAGAWRAAAAPLLHIRQGKGAVGCKPATVQQSRHVYPEHSLRDLPPGVDPLVAPLDGTSTVAWQLEWGSVCPSQESSRLHSPVGAE